MPASDRIWIDLTAKQNGNTIIMLYDASGKIVQRQSLDCTKDLLIKKSLDVSKLVAGIYQIQILMPDKNILTGKFVKQ
ncbi:MAG TPA: T9SS type A sorting domain-containing protein [Parafilimonas sp.]|nr:T9SS type A sorting domain-containing protein [Parafilimonas sp.]